MLQFDDNNLVKSNEQKDVSINVSNKENISFIKDYQFQYNRIDPNKNLLMTLSMDRVFSEGNMMNYDYISDSISFNISKSFQLFKD